MAIQVIQDWVPSRVLWSYGTPHDVRYRVFKDGEAIFQEITDINGKPIHTLELPEGLALEKTSYEVMLRYVLADVVNS